MNHIRKFINILNEEHNLSGGHDEMTAMTDEWSEDIITALRRAKFGIDREFTDGGYIIDAFGRYPDFKGKHRTIKWQIVQTHGVAYLANLVLAGKTHEVLTPEKLARITPEQYSELLANLANVIKRFGKMFGVVNRAHAVGAGIMNVTGIPGLRLPRRSER